MSQSRTAHYGLEDRLYWEILRKSNKSVIEKIRELENSQREYKEYIESWIHEVKTPITAAHLICENHKDSHATGMGLYLCSRLCRKLGLGISCESEKGRYTRMILTFPDSDHNKISEH